MWQRQQSMLCPESNVHVLEARIHCDELGALYRIVIQAKENSLNVQIIELITTENHGIVTSKFLEAYREPLASFRMLHILLISQHQWRIQVSVL